MDRIELLYSPEDISAVVKKLANQISADYVSSCPVLIGILKGAFIFLGDLVRHLTIPVEVDFMRLSSYGSGTESAGEISISKDLEISIHDRDVLVVDDIVDTGHTLNFLMKNLKVREPRSCKLVTLVDKSERRKSDIQIDYSGFKLSKGFIVGYGMDFDEKYRYLPGIYTLIKA